jgi:Predicted membrane protein (DUF2306)
MRTTLAVHIVAGGLGLVTGYVALFSAKGASLHRTSGMLFVYAMLTMTVCGFVMAAGRGVAPAINIPAALLTSCLVITGLTTVRPSTPRLRRLDLPLMLVTLGVGVASFAVGIQALAEGGGRRGLAFPLFLFGSVGVLAAGGDLRMIRAGGVVGAVRLRRHLWRMCCALFIAALSFFLGQAAVIPEPVRIPALLATPVLLVLASMAYWMWRLRGRRQSTPIVRATAAQAV